MSGQGNRLDHRPQTTDHRKRQPIGLTYRKRPLCFLSFWWPVVSALVLCSFTDLPVARGDCPPSVDDQQMQDSLAGCQNWVCDVDYDPELDGLPDEIPDPLRS